MTEINVYRLTIEDVEDIREYCNGGHHPVHLGDKLGGRFKVVHKLGHGGYGLVWLCLDTDGPLYTWRAVKVVSACESDDDGAEMQMVKFLEEQRMTLNENEDVHIAFPLEHFYVEGPNGRHLCVVLPVLGHRINEVPKATRPELKEILFQAASALGFLHRNGICHGDFRPANILLRLRDISYYAEEDMLDALGKPETEEIRVVPENIGDERQHPGPRFPRYAVSAAYLNRLPTTNEISVVDFGESFRVGSPRAFCGIPPKYAAPEVLLNCEPGLGIDVWALACTIMEIRLGFEFLREDALSSICRLETYLGPFPQPYRSAWIELIREGQFTEKPSLIPYLRGETSDSPFKEGIKQDLSKPISPREWYERGKAQCDECCKETGYANPLVAQVAMPFYIHDYPTDSDGYKDYEAGRTEMVHYKMRDEEITTLADLLTNILKYNPAERLDIAAVLAHPWFNGRGRAPEVQWKVKPRAPAHLIEEDQNKLPSDEPPATALAPTTPSPRWFDSDLSRSRLFAFFMGFLIASAVWVVMIAILPDAAQCNKACRYDMFLIARAARSSTSIAFQGLVMADVAE